MAYLDNVTNILQIQPDGLPTYVRLSQNENGRNLYFELQGNEADIPANATITISGTKPDGVVYSGTGSCTDNVVLIPETVQMTAVAGTWDAKIQITSGGNTIATGRVRFVVDADTVAPGSVPSDSELEGLVAQAQQYAETARTEAYGSPLTASTATSMTDHTRVYVYTGAESGYTAGHWYFWNGSAWTDGGVYNSTAVQTDKTLSLMDVPADGKAVGDAIATDKTLTISDAPADALVVGEKLALIKEMIAGIESAYTATKNYNVGDLLIVESSLFKATEAIATGSQINASNVAATTIASAIADLKGDLSETSKNLFEGKYTSFNGMELNDGKVVNTATDARTSFYCAIRFRNGDTNVTVSNVNVISIAGRQSITVTPNGDGNNLFIAHNGSSKNLTFYFPFNFTSGTTYTISFNVEGYNPSVVGGLVISDIQIETGDMATAYVPHIVATDYVARSSVDIVEGEISAIRNDIIQIKDDVIDIRDELYNTTEKTITAQPSGYRLNESDGLCSANSSYKLVKWLVTVGDYIKIESDDRWQFQTVASVPSSGASNRIGQTYGAGVFYATVPEGATYLVGSTPVSNSKFKAYNAYAKINSIQEDVLDNNILLYAIGAQTLLSNDAYMNQRGKVTNSSYFKTSDYILVKQGQVISYNLDSNTSTAIICFFSDKAVSSFVSYVAGTGELSEGTFTVPSDGYIRFSTRTTTIAEAYCYIQADVSPNFAADTMQKIFAGKKIVVFGDSIMADSSCASTIAEVTGATVYNCAIGGTLMAYGSDSYNIICGAKIAEAINSDSLDDIDVSGLGLSYGNTQHWNTLLEIDFTQIDMAVVSYGTNDFSFNVPTTSETAFDKSAMKTAVDYFISVMNTKYPNVQLCFFTPSYRHRTAWSGDSDEVTNGIGKYLADYEDAIYTACQENHVPCKKMYHSCGVNKYNYETYLSDGLHRTAKGGTLIGHQYAGFLEDNVI